jgi:hypothetical protein
MSVIGAVARITKNSRLVCWVLNICQWPMRERRFWYLNLRCILSMAKPMGIAGLCLRPQAVSASGADLKAGKIIVLNGNDPGTSVCKSTITRDSLLHKTRNSWPA